MIVRSFLAAPGKMMPRASTSEHTPERQQTTGSHPARVLRSCFAGGRRASNESDSYLPPQRKPSYLPTPATPPPQRVRANRQRLTPNLLESMEGNPTSLN